MSSSSPRSTDEQASATPAPEQLVKVHDVLRKNALPVKRLIGVVVVFAAILFFSWKDGTGTATGVAPAQAGSEAKSVFAREPVIPEPAAATMTAERPEAVSEKLAGTYTAGDEQRLMRELIAQGYLQFFDYRLNPDGSARITAIHTQQPLQPIVSISVSKAGNASVIVPQGLEHL